MAFDARDIQRLKNYILRDLSGRFCREIDVTADLVNGDAWLFSAYFAPGCFYREFFKLKDYADPYTFGLKFIERAVKYEKRRVGAMNNCHKTVFTERQEEYLNILYSMFDSFAKEKKYGFDVTIVYERELVSLEFSNGRSRKRCVRHINKDDVYYGNLYNIVRNITAAVERELGDHFEVAFAEYCRQDIKSVKPISVDLVKHPDIKDVIFNNPATIVFWKDGTKTVVKAIEEGYDPEKGLAMAIAKKRYGNKWSYYNVFKHWLKKYKKPEGDYEQVTYTTKLIMEED